jgi:hypothetical protein
MHVCRNLYAGTAFYERRRCGKILAYRPGRPGDNILIRQSSGYDGNANAVAFLAGSDGSWINGQVIKANGGII